MDTKPTHGSFPELRPEEIDQSGWADSTTATPLQHIKAIKQAAELITGARLREACPPELRPLMEWLCTRKRVEPCPAELLPADTRKHFEQNFGPADTYIVIPGAWVWPLAPVDKLMIYPRGGQAEDWLGLTPTELRDAMMPA